MRNLSVVFLELRRLDTTVDLEFQRCGSSLEAAASAALWSSNLGGAWGASGTVEVL